MPRLIVCRKAYRVELAKMRAILSLEQLPSRFRIAPESFDPDQPIRVLNYGRSRHVHGVFFNDR